jgi:hypothetical protein
MLAPLSPRSAPAAALRAYGGRLSRRDRIAYGGLAAGLGVAGSRVLAARFSVAGGGESGIDHHLSDIIGSPVSVAVHLTPARANRKPIVQALARGNRYPVAFAKVSSNALTGELIDAEAAALVTIAAARPPSFTVPEVLSHTTALGQQVLVMRPLPTWAGGRVPTDRELTAAAADVVDLGRRATVVLNESSYWHRLRSDIRQIGDAAKRDALQRTADRIDGFAGGREIEVGGSHGDWSPWNMWRTSQRLLVWDWERFTTDTPIGSDLVHYRLQELLVVHNARPIEAARAAVNGAADEVTGMLHLFALAVRYDKDGQMNRPTEDWLLPVIEEATTRGQTTAGQPT